MFPFRILSEEKKKKVEVSKNISRPKNRRLLFLNQRPEFRTKSDKGPSIFFFIHKAKNNAYTKSKNFYVQFKIKHFIKRKKQPVNYFRKRIPPHFSYCFNFYLKSIAAVRMEVMSQCFC